MSRYSFICFLARVVLKILFRISVEGLNNIPEKGAFIIAANHISYIDPVAAGAFIPRSIHYMARDTLFNIAPFSYFLGMCQAFPVRRGKPHPKTLKKALSILKTGEGILLFPEGTRSLNGRLGKGGPGLGMLASLCDAPIIPTFLSGTEKALPIGAGWIRFAKVRVSYGEPVHPAPSGKDEDKRKTYENLTEEVMKRISQMAEASHCKFIWRKKRFI